MKPRLNLVVTCAERKLSKPVPKLMLGDLAPAPVVQRSARWIQRLKTNGEKKMLAADLYRGNHWHIVKSIVEEMSDKIDLSVWVASAGYGLIPIDAKISAYSATFTPDTDDSVGAVEYSEKWWSAVAKWKGPSAQCPRTLAALAARDRRTPLLVVGSATYVRAMQPDILAAGTILTSKLLGVLSAGTHTTGDLAPFVIPVDSRFRRVVGGQMQALNVRVARRAIKGSRTWLRDFAILRRNIKRTSRELRPLKVHKRLRLADKAIIAFINRNTPKRSRVGYTVLLRRLRAAGMACEQSRFKRIWRRTQNRKA